MNVNLTPSLEQYVRDCASTKDYNNASEVVREAVRLHKQREDERQLKLGRLRSLIQEGDDALANGDYIEINSKQEMDDFFAKL